MSILITICARGGSKGIKNKNIKLLKGKPLIAYTIQHAKNWGKADLILVSTDSEEIASVACQYGLEVPFIRPANLATDSAPKIPVIRHAVCMAEKLTGNKYDMVIDLDTSAPIRKISDIENSYQLFNRVHPLTLFSVVPAHRNPYFNMVEEDSNGFAHVSKKMEKEYYSRQTAPKVYDMNASIYIYSRDYILDPNTKSAISSASIIYEMNELSRYDLDNELDFVYLEYLIEKGVVQLE
jgi:CMP-N,N'-diacetyllegionaminic acid synthase